MSVRREMRRVEEQKSVIVGADCDACGKALEPSMEPEHNAWRGAARLTLEGNGYGEFFDASGETQCLLCSDCILDLLGDLKWLAKAVAAVAE